MCWFVFLKYNCREKKRASQEHKLLIKQLERNRKEDEKEKEKESMHNELQREPLLNVRDVVVLI